jgi:5-hydroxyisourate hydrolase
LSGISTHILDTHRGRPAAGVPVQLLRQIEGEWEPLSSQITDSEGRVKQLLPLESSLTSGMYRIRFETGDYYREQSIEGLYPMVEVTLQVRDAGGHYHIPLLLSANGYSTYRGS